MEFEKAKSYLDTMLDKKVKISCVKTRDDFYVLPKGWDFIEFSSKVTITSITINKTAGSSFNIVASITPVVITLQAIDKWPNDYQEASLTILKLSLGVLCQEIKQTTNATLSSSECSCSIPVQVTFI